MAKTDIYGLTTNQRAFCDEYIKNLGNATQAYLKAYPNVKKEETAVASASRLLRNAKVRSYIEERTRGALDKAKLGGEAVALKLYGVAIGAPQESYSKTVNHVTGEVEEETTKTYTPSNKSSNDAAQILGKWLGWEDSNNDLNRVILELRAKQLELDIEKSKQAISTPEDMNTQIVAIANLINTPETERVLSDFMSPVEEEEQEENASD